MAHMDDEELFEDEIKLEENEEYLLKSCHRKTAAKFNVAKFPHHMDFNKFALPAYLYKEPDAPKEIYTDDPNRKRKNTIYFAKRKADEDKPFYLEDSKGKNSYTANIEGGVTSTRYVMLVKKPGKAEFEVITNNTWYKFREIAYDRKVMTLDEAEEHMKKPDKIPKFIKDKTGSDAMEERERMQGSTGDGIGEGGGRQGKREDEGTNDASGKKKTDDEFILVQRGDEGFSDDDMGEKSKGGRKRRDDDDEPAIGANMEEEEEKGWEDIDWDGFNYEKGGDDDEQLEKQSDHSDLSQQSDGPGNNDQDEVDGKKTKDLLRGEEKWDGSSESSSESEDLKYVPSGDDDDDDDEDDEDDVLKNIKPDASSKTPPPKAAPKATPRAGAKSPVASEKTTKTRKRRLPTSSQANASATPGAPTEDATPQTSARKRARTNPSPTPATPAASSSGTPAPAIPSTTPVATPSAQGPMSRDEVRKEIVSVMKEAFTKGTAMRLDDLVKRFQRRMKSGLVKKEDFQQILKENIGKGEKGQIVLKKNTKK